ncbi:hypothetical protein [Pinisolibacter sp.]|uniref:hypothetical protein n=1 Tax=Pinisolibacter sp. TaxID=2172024 RepID=UPI002FDEE70C
MNIVKSYVASARVEHRRLVKFTADGSVAHATAATDAVIGVTDCPGGADADARVDVVRLGFADVEFGGVVARGAAFTAGANGTAVAAAPATGANAFTAGVAEVTTTAGDFIRTLVAPGVIQG